MLILSFICAFLAVGPGGTGQSPERQGAGSLPVMMGPASVVAMALDANGDGEISAMELDAAPDALKKLDKNGDGKIEASELRPAGRGGREGGGRGNPDEPGETPATSPDDLVTLLMAFDKNGDGTLQKNELPERLRAIFDRADVDKNGALTAQEIRKSAAAAPQPNAMGGREGFGGREGREGRGGREGGRGPGVGMIDPLVRALDANGDGTLDASEISAAPKSLRTLDKNGDGRLTADEYRAAAPAGRS